MNKKKLRLNFETIRRLTPGALGNAVGAATTDACSKFCTQVTRCVDSCPCDPGTYPCGDSVVLTCWTCAC